MNLQELIEQIKSPDDAVRGAAWQNAGPCGAPAVQPLAEIMADQNLEVARAAKRGLWRIIRHAGRPGAAAEQQAVIKALLPQLTRPTVPVQREVLWMLSEIGGEESVEPIAALLQDPTLREDARMCLERIPHAAAITALKTALATAAEDFRPNLAHSLRMRGIPVEDYPSQKLVPTRPRTVNLPV